MNPSIISDKKARYFLIFDYILIIGIIISLLFVFFIKYIYFHQLSISFATITLACLSIIGLIPVLVNTIKAILNKELSVDLLASVALISSLLMHEWLSAAFITLMLAFARIFDHLTEAKAKNIIQSLMKYRVEMVRIRVGDLIKEIHIDLVKVGDLVIVEAGNNIPVDGIVVSGHAEINESALTGESELVPKKTGDSVFTSTINESGSLIVRTQKIGNDTTLSRIIKLIDESSREKNKVERLAGKFAGWYISIAIIASISMYLFGVDPKIILAILLVVCADDIAVAVPLTYTIAMSSIARKGVIVKGSGALEQLSKIKYLLTDKTGTLTRGKPSVVGLIVYGKWTREDVVGFFASGASESNHAVSKAIIDYSNKESIKPHVPDEFSEISGQGVKFIHDGNSYIMGRLSFIESEGCVVLDQLRNDVEEQKNLGRGLVFMAINNEVCGILSYVDDLRPNIKEIIEKTRTIGIEEWHMLTGDNERVARAIAGEIGISHYHANLTPQGKVDFIREFEKKYGLKSGKSGGVVGYIGDGVNDAAALALADVSIAIGDTGSDASIEAADITIIRSNLDRLPDTISMSKKAQSVVKINFIIWGVTNLFGLALVLIGIPGLGKIGPAGAATYNFITDFLPIINSFRARQK